jgi:hypothetical protein
VALEACAVISFVTHTFLGPSLTYLNTPLLRPPQNIISEGLSGRLGSTLGIWRVSQADVNERRNQKPARLWSQRGPWGHGVSYFLQVRTEGPQMGLHFLVRLTLVLYEQPLKLHRNWTHTARA